MSADRTQSFEGAPNRHRDVRENQSLLQAEWKKWMASVEDLVNDKWGVGGRFGGVVA